MGVYHVSGLGASPGAVCSVLHYLRDRLHRQNPSDVEFFGRSGEWRDRQKAAQQHHRPPGYLQGLVLLTTPEISVGTLRVKYEQESQLREGNALEVVRTSVRRLLNGLTGDANSSVELCIVIVPYREFDLAFERAVKVLATLRPPGKTGKEVWVNLTAGDNTLVLALNLAAALTGSVGRLYCINVAKDQERSLAHPVRSAEIGTDRDRFWIDLPVLTVQDHELRTLVLTVLEQATLLPMPDEELWTRVSQQWLHAERPLPDIATFRRQHLHAMEAQQLIERVGEHTVQIGLLWSRVRHFYVQANESVAATSLRQLAECYPDWAHWEEIEPTSA